MIVDHARLTRLRRHRELELIVVILGREEAEACDRADLIAAARQLERRLRRQIERLDARLVALDCDRRAAA